MDRGSDFDREIGKSFSLVPGEIGTFMVIIFSLLLAFFFLTGDKFSTVGLSLGYIGGPYGLQNNRQNKDGTLLYTMLLTILNVFITIETSH